MGSDYEFFLNIGTTLAIFQLVDWHAFMKQMENSFVSGLPRSSALSFKTIIGMFSGPVAFEQLRFPSACLIVNHRCFSRRLPLDGRCPTSCKGAHLHWSSISLHALAAIWAAATFCREGLVFLVRHAFCFARTAMVHSGVHHVEGGLVQSCFGEYPSADLPEFYLRYCGRTHQGYPWSY